MFRGKKYQESAKQIDKNTLYEAADGMALICKTASAKFDETVELHVKLGVDSRHADQQVRGAIVLPHGTGKTVRVLVFAKGDKADAAREAGADHQNVRVAVPRFADGLPEPVGGLLPLLGGANALVVLDAVGHSWQGRPEV